MSFFGYIQSNISIRKEDFPLIMKISSAEIHISVCEEDMQFFCRTFVFHTKGDTCMMMKDKISKSCFDFCYYRLNSLTVDVLFHFKNT